MAVVSFNVFVLTHSIFYEKMATLDKRLSCAVLSACQGFYTSRSASAFSLLAWAGSLLFTNKCKIVLFPGAVFTIGHSDQ